MKALIVDDNDLYRDVLEMVLIESGYKVWSAINGADALKILLEDLGDQFDLIVTDHEMPILSGGQLIREIIKREIKFQKVILLSSSFDVNPFVKEFVSFDRNIFVVPKDTPITHLQLNHFKI